jgi:hypothetical protein
VERRQLAHPQASISPKFFYDALGSNCSGDHRLDTTGTHRRLRYFEASRWPTRSTARPDGALPDRPGRGQLRQNSSADSAPAQYVPVDISTDFLQDAASRSRAAFPAFAEHRQGGHGFSNSLAPDAVQPQNRSFLPAPAWATSRLHRRFRFCSVSEPSQGNARARPADVDLIRTQPRWKLLTMTELTAAFNKNMLRHVSTLLGAEGFDVRQWRHVARFNTAESRIEMRRATAETVVQWATATPDALQTTHPHQLLQVHRALHDSAAAANRSFQTCGTGPVRKAGSGCSGRWCDTTHAVLTSRPITGRSAQAVQLNDEGWEVPSSSALVQFGSWSRRYQLG